MKKNNTEAVARLLDYIINEDNDRKELAHWKEKFATFNNTPEERKELIYDAFSCSGNFRKQKNFCDTANRFGYFT